jgi:hypothetical protein
MRVEFAAQSSRDGQNVSANTARLVNCYLEPLMPGAKGQSQIRAVPGMEAFADLGKVWMRAVAVYDDQLHAVCGGDLFRIAADGTVETLDSVGESPETTMADNTGFLTIVANGDYFTWDGTTLNTPSPGAITEVGSVSYLGGYTILTEKDGRRIQWSALADPETFSGLDFASAETTDKAIIRGVVWRDVLMVFKAQSIEQWARTGGAGPDAFQRIPGADFDIGLRGHSLVASFPAGLAFASSDGKIMLYAGGLRPISTPPMESALAQYTPLRMFYYEQRGHGFICVTFQGAAAWCYDLATGEWHEREEDGGAWTAAASIKWGENWFVGSDTGRVAKLVARCRDFNVRMVRMARSLPMLLPKPTVIASLELFPRMGMDRQANDDTILDDGESALSDDELHFLGDGGPDDQEAQISIRTSRDGVVFGPEKVRSLGQPGQHDLRVIWRQLGQFRSIACFEVRLSSDTDIPLASSGEVMAA